MSEGVSEARPGAPEATPGTDMNALVLPVEVGRRVMVVANLGLRPAATPASTWASNGLARALDGWEGPGLVIVAGNLFDLEAESAGDGADGGPGAALSAHPRLQDSLRDFAAGEDRQVICLPGKSESVAGAEPPAAWRRTIENLGLEVAPSVDLHLAKATGTRVVRVCAGVPNIDVGGDAPGAPDGLGAGSGGAGGGASSSGGGGRVARVLSVTPDRDAPWQSGLDRLADPATVQRFLTSRLLYRRFARLAWWLLLPLAAALILRLPFVATGLDHLFFGHAGPKRAINAARSAGWGPRLLVAAVASAVELAVLAAVLALLGRKAWRTLGGGQLQRFFGNQLSLAAGSTANDPARDAARALTAGGYAGMVTGATLQAELTNLGQGFFACAGTTGEVVEEHPGRVGLLPVFLEHRQLAWVELETGAELHARLLLARVDVPPATVLERIGARHSRSHDNHPVVVAAYPQGASWPPGPDLGALLHRARRVRRWTAAAIAAAGLIDLVSALTPPLRGRLHLILEVLPLGASQAAGALVALSGLGLLALARGVRRGQHRAWAISVALLAATTVLHILRGVDVEESVLSAAVIALLLVNRSEFKAKSDPPSLRSAVWALAGGVVGITVAATAAAEVAMHFHKTHFHLSVWKVGEAVVERLAGVQTVLLPNRLNEFLAPSLLALGVMLAIVALVLATRPVVDRRMGAGWLAEIRARDVVRRHGEGTLDYFSLRSDKQWFFHRDSLVAYAIYGGVCLVSPDPIGPRAEREQVWGAFRRFADSRGWVVSVMGAGEEWLPLYRASGMHDIYIGDEAVIDLGRFSLGGGQMKGLRQAHNRVIKYGYTVSFHDPSRLDRASAESLTGLMSQSRRGDFERGFSMMLGRIFDPRDEDLVLCIVTGPDGRPAAMCQFVPARGIGGYSLDLMRRDRGEHPNGLIDFALVSSIEHFKEMGCKGLSLNFAAMREILEGERGDGVTQRVERWAIKKLSSFFQIETLWRFNAKYYPDWLPRYVVFDTAEHLVPVVLAIMRAESLAEAPVIGKMLTGQRRRAAAAAGLSVELDDSGASLLPAGDEGPDAGEVVAPAPPESAPDTPGTPVAPGTRHR